MGTQPMKTTTIDIGDTVLCDGCNKNWTGSDESSGFIFGSYAYGPCCAERMMETIKKYDEEKYIRAACRDGESFWQFVLRYRKGDNTVKITTL